MAERRQKAAPCRRVGARNQDVEQMIEEPFVAFLDRGGEHEPSELRIDYVRVRLGPIADIGPA